MDEQALHKLWETEVEILDAFDAFCREHHLRYSLAYGTLLGAVRHQGMIPWDDDVDVVMPREDYEFFLKNWNISGYVLVNKDLDDSFPQNQTKIRKENTAFLQYEWEREKTYHKGIFIDVFAGDRVAPGKLSRKLQIALCAVNLLYTREYTSRNNGFLERFLLKFPKGFRTAVRKKTEKLIAHWNGNPENAVFFWETMGSIQCVFPSNIFNALCELPFEGGKYSSFCDYDIFLRTCYGDYMQLPPASKRVYSHHPIVVDFEKEV